MTLTYSHHACCSQCRADMGVIEADDEYPDVSINNTEMTVHVGNVRCSECETVIFRAQRRMRLVVRRE